MEPLIQAVIHNEVAQVVTLLQQGADPNGYLDDAYISPLHFAAQCNAQETAMILLCAGADLHARTSEGLTPVNLAELHGHQDMMHLLYSADNDPVII